MFYSIFLLLLLRKMIQPVKLILILKANINISIHQVTAHPKNPSDILFHRLIVHIHHPTRLPAGRLSFLHGTVAIHDNLHGLYHLASDWLVADLPPDHSNLNFTLFIFSNFPFYHLIHLRFETSLLIYYLKLHYQYANSINEIDIFCYNFYFLLINKNKTTLQSINAIKNRSSCHQKAQGCRLRRQELGPPY